MANPDYARKLAEVDRLLNDPDVPMEAARVWSLLAEIAQQGPPLTAAAPLSRTRDFRRSP